MNCIFCKKYTESSNIEHILPESLGGKQWACLAPGVVCSECNQYFGSKVEELALGSHPFLVFRLFLGIPTKHNKPAKMNTHLGLIKSSIKKGTIGIDPSSIEIERGLKNGDITQIRILAEPTRPQAFAICRLLLKMGLEVVAYDSVKDALGEKFDEARIFARAPVKGSDWWFLLHTDFENLTKKFVEGFTLRQWFEDVTLEVIDVGGGEVFHLKLLDLDLFTPLEKNIKPELSNEFPEPEFQLFKVKVE